MQWFLAKSLRKLHWTDPFFLFGTGLQSRPAYIIPAYIIFAIPVASTGVFSISKYISIQVAFGPKDNCTLFFV